MKHFFCLLAVIFATSGLLAQEKEDFVPLFNGKDFTGWKLPDDAKDGPWQIVDGVIDCDVRRPSKAKEKSLFSDKSYGDFVLKVDWKIKDTPYTNPFMRDVQPDGSDKKGADGKVLGLNLPDTDSGIYIRGSSKAQVNIWCWPVGSGEVYGYRMDAAMPASVRTGVTPKKKMDKPIGEWNTFEITVKKNNLWVKLNGEPVLTGVELPGLPETGPIALQFHGAYNEATKKFTSPPSQVQFRNILIKELK